MRLDQLTQLIEIGRRRSISQAAEQLHISQPALSASIKRLESELGTVLFKRSKRGVTLTADGDKICREAATIIAILESWNKDGKKDDVKGEVHVVSIPIISSYISQNIIDSFQKIYPGITVFVHNVRHNDVIERLKNTNANIALTTLSLYSKLLSQVDLLEWKKCMLATDERRIFIGATHPLASKAELTIEDMAGLHFAWYSDSKDQVSRCYVQYFAASYRLANKEDILGLVIQNKAAFIQPYRMFRNDWRVRANLLVDRVIPLPDIDHTTSMYAFHAPVLSYVETLFWDYLVDQFPRHL